MNAKITFCRTTVKTLTHELHLAWQTSDLPRIKRLTALVGVAERHPVGLVAERLGSVPRRFITGSTPFSGSSGSACGLDGRLAGRPS